MTTTQEASTKLFLSAYERRATDIHFHPYANHTSILFRTEGVLRERHRFPRANADKLVAHLKFQSGMDIGERRLPQNGSLTIKHREGSLSLRLSTVPIGEGERLVVRLLPADDEQDLASLPLLASASRDLHALAELEHGLIIFTGPTGSGKTTTMYALLNEMSRHSIRHVISVEDPIEKPREAFTQMQVNEQAGLYYPEALKAALRHDPDVLMIGEIRDEHTAKIAVRAAMTGHLVLTTLHTRNTSGALVRLLEFGVPANYLYESMAAVIAQRLVYDANEQRKAIFGFLADEPLQAVLDDCVQKLPLSFDDGLEKQRLEGIALGLLANEEERAAHAT
ncbi:competence type IV pilus ATPase ComGA [Natribacillus halophilus]|uniref:Competence-related pilin export protein ComGA n=1 Tax=Natribacillus halophilus TaxID=549003 RepID=A0A1G8JMG8_9BACI|nr:competence type IV pilus ATPase ComGA [Natribacillus halophilus]SDI32489.1 competence-related pilin export protein ComGA [Natribacillus halophilus]